MKTLTLGCVGAMAGLVLGILLTLGASSLWTPTHVAQAMPIANVTRGDVTITISAKYLDAQLQHIVKQTNLAKQATVTLVAPDRARVQATLDTNILGRTLSANTTIEVRLAVHNGRVALSVERIDVSGVGVARVLVTPLVNQWRAQAENHINTALQRELQRTGLRLTGLRITPSELVIELTMQ